MAPVHPPSHPHAGTILKPHWTVTVATIIIASFHIGVPLVGTTITAAVVLRGLYVCVHAIIAAASGKGIMDSVSSCDATSIALMVLYFLLRVVPTWGAPHRAGRLRSAAVSRSWPLQAAFIKHPNAAIHFDLSSVPGIAPGSSSSTSVDASTEEAATVYSSSGRYLVCAHPHGLVGHSCWASFVTLHDRIMDVFVKRGLMPVVFTMNANFAVPVWRDIVLALGFSSCDRSSIVYALTGRTEKQRAKNAEGDATGRLALLVPGGAEESLYCCDPTAIKLRNRLGFVKIALTTNTELVPMYSFGEADLYRPISSKLGTNPPFIQKLKKAMHIGLPLIRGRFGTTVPLPAQMVIVVGRPYNPRDVVAEMRGNGDQGHGPYTPAEIEAAHAKYVAHLCALYERNQPRYAPQYKPHLNIL